MTNQEHKPEASGKKTGRRRRILLRIAAGLVGVVLVLLIALRLSLPGIIRGQAELQAREHLGVPVTIGSVGLSIFGGSIDLKDVVVQAPEGFTEKEFARIRRVSANVGLRSLLSDVIVIEEVNIRQGRANLEASADGRRSLRTILENLERKAAEQAEEAEQQPEEPEEPTEEVEDDNAPAYREKGIRINRINVTDFSVRHTDAFATPGSVLTTSSAFSALEIRDIYLPPTSRAEEPALLHVTLTDFSLTAPAHFQESAFLKSPSLEVEYDLGATVTAPRNQSVTIIPRIEQTGLSFIAETMTEDHPGGGMPQNLHEFLVVMQNTTSEDPPKTLEQIAAEMEEEKSTRRKKDRSEPSAPQDPTVEAAVVTTETVIETAEAAENMATQPAEEELPARFVLKRLAVTGMFLRQITHFEPAQNYQVTDGAIEIVDFALPHEPGNNARITASARPLHEDSRFSMTVVGDLANSENPQNVKIDATVEEQHLRNIGDLERGVVNSVLDLTVAEKRLNGSISVKVRNLRMKGMVGSFVNVSSQAMETLYPEPVVLVIDQPLEGDGSWEDIMSTLGKSLESNLKNLLKDMTNRLAKIDPAMLGEQAEVVGEGLRSAGEGMLDAGDEVRDATTDGVRDAAREVENTGRRVGEGLRGILGRKEKEEQ